MDLELAGKTALVTGGSRGIGKQVARQLALEGVDVAIVARNQETLEATARELQEETGRKIVPLAVDTTDDEGVRDAVRQATEALGHIDILVNCAARAAVGPPPKLAQSTSELFFDEMNTKVMGYLRTAREVAPQMIERGWGRIINISGLAARSANSPIGSMRNVAVTAMTKNLADELGQHGINCTTVHPGLTRTENTTALWTQRAKEQGLSLEEFEQRQIAQGNISRRVIDARDIANVVTFLASPRSGAINGDVIAAGGGAPGAIYY